MNKHEVELTNRLIDLVSEYTSGECEKPVACLLEYLDGEALKNGRVFTLDRSGIACGVRAAGPHLQLVP